MYAKMVINFKWSPDRVSSHSLLSSKKTILVRLIERIEYALTSVYLEKKKKNCNMGRLLKNFKQLTLINTGFELGGSRELRHKFYISLLK